MKPDAHLDNADFLHKPSFDNERYSTATAQEREVVARQCQHRRVEAPGQSLELGFFLEVQ